jgi:hypothetical protein
MTECFNTICGIDIIRLTVTSNPENEFAGVREPIKYITLKLRFEFHRSVKEFDRVLCYIIYRDKELCLDTNALITCRATLLTTMNIAVILRRLDVVDISYQHLLHRTIQKYYVSIFFIVDKSK